MVLELAGNLRQKYIYTKVRAHTHTNTHTVYRKNTARHEAKAETTRIQKHNFVHIYTYMPLSNVQAALVSLLSSRGDTNPSFPL